MTSLSPIHRTPHGTRAILLLGCLLLALGLAVGLGGQVTASGPSQESPISPVSPLETVAPLVPSTPSAPSATATPAALPSGPVPETGQPSLVLIGLIVLGLAVVVLLFLRRK